MKHRDGAPAEHPKAYTLNVRPLSSESIRNSEDEMGHKSHLLVNATAFLEKETVPLLDQNMTVIFTQPSTSAVFTSMLGQHKTPISGV